MSKFDPKKFEVKDLEPIESKVDRINNRILEIMNSSRMSFTDSEVFSPSADGTYRKTFGDTEISITDKLVIYEE